MLGSIVGDNRELIEGDFVEKSQLTNTGSNLIDSLTFEITGNSPVYTNNITYYEHTLSCDRSSISSFASSCSNFIATTNNAPWFSENDSYDLSNSCKNISFILAYKDTYHTYFYKSIFIDYETPDEFLIDVYFLNDIIKNNTNYNIFTVGTLGSLSLSFSRALSNGYYTICCIGENYF